MRLKSYIAMDLHHSHTVIEAQTPTGVLAGVHHERSGGRRPGVFACSAMFPRRLVFCARR